MEIGLLILGVIMLAREYTFYMREQDRDKREEQLLQRIQAPEIAVQSHAVAGLPEREPVGAPLGSDEEYWKLVNGN